MNKERQQELIEKMKYVTILDFEVSKVFQYEVNEMKIETANRDYENYIIDKGHNLNNCEWMIHEESQVFKN